jgi:tight adherence protein B
VWVLTALLAALSAVLFAAGRDCAGPRRAASRRLVRYLRRAGGPGGHDTVFARADRYMLRLPAVAALERQLRQAGVAAPPSAVLAAGVSACVIAGVAAAARWGLPAGLAAPAAVALPARMLLLAARGRRVRRIETQLPGALDMLVGQLRAHRSIAEAVSDVAQWIRDPLGAECARVADDLRVGAPLAQALDRFCERVPSPAIPAIVSAIVISDRTGANLAGCLSRLAAAARTQIAFRHEVSAMTAHARATGATLTLLPAGVAAALLLFDRGVFAPMITTAPGRVLLGTAAAMELIGWYAIRRMIRRVDA